MVLAIVAVGLVGATAWARPLDGPADPTEVATLGVTVALGDGTPPVIAITPPSGAYFADAGAPLTLDAAATDPESGIASVTATVNGTPQALPYVLTAPGGYAFEVTATNGVGGTSTKTANYTIYSIDASPGRVSGSIYAPRGVYRVTLSVDARRVAGQAPTGRVSVFDSGTRMNFAATQLTTVGVVTGRALVMGAGTVNGKSGYTFRLNCSGPPYAMDIVIYKSDGSTFFTFNGKAKGGSLNFTPG